MRTEQPIHDTEAALEPVPLQVVLGGRMSNITKLKHWYMAVAEIAQNAIDSLGQSGRTGEVHVVIHREPTGLDGLETHAPVKSIDVYDSGDGFTERNFESFCTPDSILKRARGGKGLGRLMALQAFGRVLVSSTYQHDGSFRLRKVILQVHKPELQAAERLVTATEYSTRVTLDGLLPTYDAVAVVSPFSIIDWLTEHFLPLLVERPAWLSHFRVTDGEISRDLLELVNANSAWKAPFRLGAYDFQIVCYGIQDKAKAERVWLVAGGRIVPSNTEKLEFYLPHLNAISEAKPHLILVHSTFFDEHVNDARNGVSFSDDSDPAGVLAIKAADFRAACGHHMRKHLEARVSESSEAFKVRVSRIVGEQVRHYRPMLETFFASKEFKVLSSDSKDEDILSSLDIFRRRESERTKKESNRLIKLKAGEDEFKERARQLVQDIGVQKKVVLAEYVALRKLILDQLEQLIETDEETGKAHREAAIHNLVFAQRTDSEADSGLDHQLWLLDDRLESHEYLASDQPLRGNGGTRPDLLIALNAPGVFAAQPFSSSAGYERIVLIEFKQALREMGKGADNWPHNQMLRYAHEIEAGRAKHVRSGRPIGTTTNVRFYMYAVCEISKEFMDRLVMDGFTAAPTGDGAFRVTAGRYYCEYISLTKLLEDAKMRNAAFFEKLGV